MTSSSRGLIARWNDGRMMMGRGVWCVASWRSSIGGSVPRRHTNERTEQMSRRSEAKRSEAKRSEAKRGAPGRPPLRGQEIFPFRSSSVTPHSQTTRSLNRSRIRGALDDAVNRRQAPPSSRNSIGCPSLPLPPPAPPPRRPRLPPSRAARSLQRIVGDGGVVDNRGVCRQLAGFVDNRGVVGNRGFVDDARVVDDRGAVLEAMLWRAVEVDMFEVNCNDQRNVIPTRREPARSACSRSIGAL